MIVHCHLAILKQVPKYSKWEMEQNRTDICIFVCSGWILILVGKWGLGVGGNLAFFHGPTFCAVWIFTMYMWHCKKKKKRLTSYPFYSLKTRVTALIPLFAALN